MEGFFEGGELEGIDLSAIIGEESLVEPGSGMEMVYGIPSDDDPLTGIDPETGEITGDLFEDPEGSAEAVYGIPSFDDSGSGMEMVYGIPSFDGEDGTSLA